MTQSPNNPDSNPADDGRKLRGAESEALARHIADVVSVELPLAAGLRAAAQETGSRRLAGALRSLAAGIDAGRSLEEILADRSEQFPQYYRRLISAAASSGRLGEVLSEVIETRHRSRQLWQTIYSAMAYPALIVSLTLGLFVFMSLFVLPPIAGLYDEFGMTLPPNARVLFWCSATGVWWLLEFLAGLTVLALLTRLIVGVARWQRIISTIPFFGSMGHWSAVAEMTRLLGLLIDQQVPLPDALRHTAEGIGSPNMRQVCGGLANDIQGGKSLSSALADSRQLPRSLVPLVLWGEQSAALPEALRTAGEVFERRVRQRASVLKTVFPPLLFLIVAISIVSLTFALYTPLFGMIVGLSS